MHEHDVVDTMSAAGFVTLDNPGGLELAELGAKAARLVALRAEGRPVPDGVVLPASLAGTADAGRIAEIAAAVWAHFDGRPLAVRSSAVAEDRADASFAGLYESVLDVTNLPDLIDAIGRVVASADSPRIGTYEREASGGAIAVLIQPMVAASAAGVAFGADPVTGERGVVVISAVTGTGERLVSGEATGEDWVVDERAARAVAANPTVLTTEQARAIARLTTELSGASGTPQDVEWAIADGALYVLQARPMTALPDPVVWATTAKAPFWRRDFRLGEWLPEPVTPLFESWFLPEHDHGFLSIQLDEFGGASEPPYHAVVNGWCYSSIGHPGKRTAMAFGRHPLRIVKWGIAFGGAMKGRNPRRAERWMAAPAWEIHESRTDHEYRAAVDQALASVDTATVTELPALVTMIVRRFGALVFPMVECAGFAWKAEFALARFYDVHLRSTVGGTHQELLAGLRPPQAPKPHAVTSLDWSQPTLGERADPPLAPSQARYTELVERRTNAEQRCRNALGSGRRREKFEECLDIAQRYAVLRENFVAEMTFGWPAMRRALRRIGVHGVALGAIDDADDVFWLTRSEAETIVAGDRTNHSAQVAMRKQLWARRRRLDPPVALGKAGHSARVHGQLADRSRSGAVVASDTCLVGVPASPGRASGPVRVVRGPEDFDSVCPGDVLVASLTAPAWTPLFARVAAVVTDGGSLAAHASLIAREYGIPAVVATHDATHRLSGVAMVLVDGSRGVVEIQ